MYVLIVLPDDIRCEGCIPFPEIQGSRYSKALEYEESLEKIYEALSKHMKAVSSAINRMNISFIPDSSIKIPAKSMARAAVKGFLWGKYSGGSIEEIISKIDKASKDSIEVEHRKMLEFEHVLAGHTNINKDKELDSNKDNKELDSKYIDNEELDSNKDNLGYDLMCSKNSLCADEEYVFIDSFYVTVPKSGFKKFNSDIEKHGQVCVTEIKKSQKFTIFKVYCLKGQYNALSESMQNNFAIRKTKPEEAVDKNVTISRYLEFLTEALCSSTEIYMNVLFVKAFVESLQRYGEPPIYQYKLIKKKEIEKFKTYSKEMRRICESSDEDCLSFTVLEIESFL